MLRGALKTVRDSLFTLAYPQQCRGCGRAVESWDDGVACASCWNDWLSTHLFTEPLCPKCGLPLKQQACNKCEALLFSSARACGIYSGAVEANILFLKSNPHLCPRLRQTIIQTFLHHQTTLASDLIMPVPLHFRRKRERGFNQATIIARAISAHCDAPVDDRSIARVKHTEMHRAGMDRVDRAKSVERAFEVVRPGLLKGASVMVVDDVYTTGSTINALTIALLEAGVQSVNVFTIARVLPGSAPA